MTATPDVNLSLKTSAHRRAAAGDTAGALVLLDEALIQNQSDAEAARLLAALAVATDPARAVATARALLTLDPSDTGVLNSLAQGLAALEETAEAVGIFARIAALTPTDGGAHCNLALALLRAGRADESAATARSAIELRPDLAEAHANLGHALNALPAPDAAIAAFQACLRLRPEHPDTLLGLARAYMTLGRPSTAVLALRRAAMGSSGSANIQTDLGNALQALGMHEDALAAHRRAMALAPGQAMCGSNLLMALQYVPEAGDAAMRAEAESWGARQCMVPAVPRPPGGWDGSRPLRIGYVSADLWRHPVGFLGAGAIARHNRPDVAVFIYANQTVSDDLTQDIAAAVDVWRPIAGIGDEAAARLIAADQIDILVDLSGHTGGNRLGVFARRPAPVQVSWLGYFATTGLPAMDAVLLDDEHVSPGGEAWFSERAIRLPMGRFCYTPPPYAPNPGVPPGGPPLFGCFNNSMKLNDSTLALWSRVLDAVPDSRLLLKWRGLTDPVLSARLRNTFARRGSASERSRLEDHEPHEALLAAYARVAVALDPMPFTGALTTCEALWMGVPVVTLPGTRAVSRQSHAILSRIGRAAWSARDADDYVAIAARLAAAPPARESLRDAMRASPLCDPAGFASGLETTYRALCREARPAA